MDADTRHQLKQNELAEMLSKLADLRDPKFLYTAGALVVIVVAVLAWYGWRYTQRQALEQGWQRLAKASTALMADDPAAVAGAENDLRAMVRDTSSRQLVSYARLALARSLIETGLLQPATRQASFDEAVNVLTQLRSDPEAPKLIDAPATFLLATAYESLHQFDKAKELYQALTTGARFAGSPYVALATGRLADIDSLSAPVVFTPGNPPAPTPTSAPTTAATQGMTPIKLEKLDPSLIPPAARQMPPPVTQPAAGAAPAGVPQAPPPTQAPPAQPAPAPATPESAPSPAP